MLKGFLGAPKSYGEYGWVSIPTSAKSRVRMSSYTRNLTGMSERKLPVNNQRLIRTFDSCSRKFQDVKLEGGRSLSASADLC